MAIVGRQAQNVWVERDRARFLEVGPMLATIEDGVGVPRNIMAARILIHLDLLAAPHLHAAVLVLAHYERLI